MVVVFFLFGEIFGIFREFVVDLKVFFLCMIGVFYFIYFYMQIWFIGVIGCVFYDF